uniref:SARAH domain-containing protein n=1 Tax=Neogobius melanostomus TaxID=47308 RepID=A0A8C6SFW7_9GOBI
FRSLNVNDTNLCASADSFCFACVLGRDETMQPAKPAFLEYFEQKEKEANVHNEAGENNADHRKLPADGHLEVLQTWTVEELRLRLASLDPQMEQEIEEIHQRYQTKRQPILDAIEAKKRRQQNF